MSIGRSVQSDASQPELMGESSALPPARPNDFPVAFRLLHCNRRWFMIMYVCYVLCRPHAVIFT
jgi:hypothetical protein